MWNHGVFLFLIDMKAEDVYKAFKESSVACIDTRKIIPGCIFFALKGPKFDGNKYAEEALNKGAKYAVIDNKKYYKRKQTLLVNDSLKTLQDIAKIHRKKSAAKVFAITGSNGKTTTKELINSVLRQKYRIISTQGNLNNHIGVPLTLLEIKEDTEIAVIEMGANHIGEIDELCEIATPGYGIITNVGNAHLEGFGSFEGVKEGKSELFKSLRKNNGITFINKDNPYLKEMIEEQNVKEYSLKSGAYCTAEIIKDDGYIGLQWCCGKFQGSFISNLKGKYNAENFLAAVTVANYFNISPNKTDLALSEYKPANQRSELKKTKRNNLFIDLYNANPTSMEAAIDEFNSNYNNKVLILGDMKELGDYSEYYHEKILKKIKNLGFDEVYLSGTEFYKLRKKYKYLFFKDTPTLKDYLSANKIKDKWIFIKGSRSMKLEEVIDVL